MNVFRDPTSGRSWVSPHELIDHIVTAHHDYVRMTLPELDEFSDRIAHEFIVPRRIRDGMCSELATLADLLERHVSEQENWLFPMIRHMREAGDQTEWDFELGDCLDWLMDRVAHENVELLGHMERLQGCLRELAGSGNEMVVANLAEQVEGLCKDVPKHARLETDVLIPWVKELIKEEGLVSSGQYW